MKKKWLTSVLTVCILCTLMGGGAVAAFALDDSKEAVTVQDMNWHSDWNGILVGMSSPFDGDDSSGWGTCDSANVTVMMPDGQPHTTPNYVAGGNNKSYISLLGFSSPAPVGTVVTIKAGYSWGTKEVKGDVSYIYSTLNQPFTLYDPTGFTAAESTKTIMAGANATIAFTTDPAYTVAPVSYGSADTAIATVAGDGLSATITAVAEGTTTVTATLYGGRTATVAVTVTPAVELSSISVAENAKISVYKGATLTQAHLTDLGAKKHFTDGQESAFTVTTDMLSGLPADYNTVGTHTVIITCEGKTATVPLEIVERPALTVADVNYVHTGWGIMVGLNENSGLTTESVADPTFVEVKTSQGVSTLDKHGVLKHQNYIFMPLTEASIALGYAPAVGTTVTVKQGTVWKEYEAKSDITYIYAEEGKPWVAYNAATHAVTSLTINNETTDNIVRVDATKRITYTVNEGAVCTPDFSSSDTNVATVDPSGQVLGIAVGTATITVQAGNQTKTYEVEVKPALTVKTVEPVTKYDVYVAKGGTFALPADFTARAVFDDQGAEVKGQEFPLTVGTGGNTVIVDAVDTATASEEAITVNIKVTYKEVEYPLTVTAYVYEIVPMQIKEVAIVEWFNFGMFVQFPNSSMNAANLTDSAVIPDAAKYKYYRSDGTEVACGTYNLGGGNIAVLPAFINIMDGDKRAITLETFNKDDRFYRYGDKIVLQQGIAGYRWTGQKDGNDNPIAKTGMMIKECELAAEATYMFDGEVWVLYVAYTDMEVGESLEVVLNNGKSLGAKRVPVEATEGRFYYTVADETVAIVNANGRVTGKKIGTTTVTVTLKDGAAGEKTRTVTITVVDGIKELSLGDLERMEIKRGKTLNLTKIQATLVYESGKTEAADLSTAEIVGLDSKVVGEQEVTITVMVGGKPYSAVLIVNVKPNGCRSVGTGVSCLAAALALIALAGVALTKKRLARK